MTVERVIEQLDDFVSSGDETEDVAGLYEILDGFGDLQNRENAVSALFDLLERNPEAILGSPGPIVHALAGISGYEFRLRESLLRQPTYLTVWMVNRILNTNLREDERRRWQHLLSAASNQTSSELAREEAEHFVSYQKAEGRWLGA